MYGDYIVWQQLPEGGTAEQVHELWLYLKEKAASASKKGKCKVSVNYISFSKDN